MQLKDLIEHMKIGFTNLTGSEEKPVTHIRELFKFADTTPFHKRDVLEYFATTSSCRLAAGLLGKVFD